MKDKYYTPDITDIRVGYECEISDMGISPIWTKYIVSHTAINNELPIIIPSRVVDFIENYHPKRVRVPYLTKEQIEAEGWVYRNSMHGEYSESLEDRIDFFEIKEDDVIFHLEFNKKLHSIHIYVWGTNSGTSTLFTGRCPSINELRYISKLLGICT